MKLTTECISSRRRRKSFASWIQRQRRIYVSIYVCNIFIVSSPVVTLTPTKHKTTQRKVSTECSLICILNFTHTYSSKVKRDYLKIYNFSTTFFCLSPSGIHMTFEHLQDLRLHLRDNVWFSVALLK